MGIGSCTYLMSAGHYNLAKTFNGINARHAYARLAGQIGEWLSFVKICSKCKAMSLTAVHNLLELIKLPVANSVSTESSCASLDGCWGSIMSLPIHD